MVSARAKGYLVVAAAFALGVAAGGAGMHAYARRHAAPFGEGARAFETRRIHALARKLDLDAAQQEKIVAIFDAEHDEMRRLGREMMDKCGDPLRGHKAKIDGEIRAVLRPDQQKRYDALVDERREHMWIGPLLTTRGGE